jgi:hypothetical protein
VIPATSGGFGSHCKRCSPPLRQAGETISDIIAATTANVDLIRPSEALDLRLSVDDVKSSVCPPRAPHLSQIMKRHLAGGRVGDDAVGPGG